MPNNFIGEPFSVSLISGIEKFCAKEAFVTIFGFLSNFFCLTVPKDFVGEPLSVSLVSGTEKVWIGEGGGIKIFRRKFFVSQCRNFPYWGPFSVSIISGTEKFG